MKRLSLGLMLLWLAALAQPALATDTVYYYYTNTLHSAVVETDAQGNIVEQTTHYAPYGQVLNRSMRDGPGYTGHEEDPATGLNYMQQRYYDPQSGRFVSTDPVVPTDDGGNFNRYEYANDNPYRYTDPDGRQEADEGAEETEELRQELHPLLRPITAEEYKQELARQELEPQTLGKLEAENAKLLSGEAGRDAERQIQKFVGKLMKPPTGPGKVSPSERDPKRFFTPAEREAKRAEQGNQCATGCGAKIDSTNSIGHHIERHADGGQTKPGNHAEVCPDCHRKLHSKDDNE